MYRYFACLVPLLIVGLSFAQDFQGVVTLDGKDYRVTGTLSPIDGPSPDPEPTSPLAVTGFDVISWPDGITENREALDEAKQYRGGFLTIVARAGDAVSSVRLTAGDHVKIENAAPYALHGDSGGKFNPAIYLPGVYAITAQGFSGPNATGEAGPVATVMWTIVGDDPDPDPPVDPDPDPPVTGQADGEYRDMLVGMNTSWNTYWVPDWPFADAVKCMRPPDNIIVSGIGPHVPAGDYVLTWQGTGDLNLNTGQVISSQPGRKVVRVAAGNEYLALSMSGGLMMADVHCWFPGQEGRMFHEDFVEALSNFAVVRHLNWGRVNSSEVETWADRRSPNDPRQQGRPGVAYEYMAWLANTCKNDPWVCVPHLADDDHIRRMAKLFLEELDPDRKIYVEFTNEFWNTIFSQGDWAWNEPTGETAGEKMGRRIANSHKIWDEVWSEAGQRHRLELVVMGQAFSHFVTKQMVLQTEANGGPIDAIGVAGYFGARGQDVNSLINGLKSNAGRFPQTDNIAESKQLADDRGLPFYLYECGHHVEVPHQTNEATLKAAMRDQRMAEVYAIALERYADFGCEMVVFFDYANRIDDKAFGHVEYQGQPLSEAPKMRALIEGMKAK